jgi:transcriptional regulator of acetoin/glycerol metabolism
MQPLAYPIQHDKLHEAWETFLQTGRLPTAVESWFDQNIWHSWRRCRPRIDAYSQVRPRRLQDTSLASMRRTSTDLITVSLPFMEDIYQYTVGSNCAILLANSTSCLLEMAGDPNTINRLLNLGLRHGTYWSEGQLGTNALGLALWDAMPTQVVGAEHYLQRLHDLVTTAAPLHDANGRIIGVLGVVSPVESASTHDVALVMSSARAISSQLQTDFFLEEANRNLKAVNTVLEAMVEGVLSWDDQGIVTHVNEQAASILKVNTLAVLGTTVNSWLGWPTAVQDAIQNEEPLQDVEATLTAHGQHINCLLGLSPLPDSGGYIAVLRPLAQVRRLVQQQVGTQAHITLDDFYSDAPTMGSIIRQARIAARGNAPVLIRGEGGVGKNPLARAIHNASERANEPFVSINCRAIPHELMLEEILGYEDSHNGRRRPSKFELADHGTLFLDQIDSLSLEMQANLLHVLEMGQVLRLGNNYPVSVNIRLIVATSNELEKLVAENSFNAQLYYRFGIFDIKIPPLRERIEDIPLLAERFLARRTAKSKRPIWLSDPAREILLRYPWPGNVRELENALERAMIHTTDGVIRPHNLPEIVRRGRVITPQSPQPQPMMTAEEAEREAIIQAGWHCHGRVGEMANQLGIGRTTLWRKMKTYGLSASQFRHQSA